MSSPRPTPSSPSQFTPFLVQPSLPFSESEFRTQRVLGLHILSSHLVGVVGIGFGDEGKGRTIPDISAVLRASTGKDDVVGVVFKVNGGANSGHTVDGLKLNLLPGAVADPLVSTLGIGRGVVADPLKFLWEGHFLERKGYSVFGRLLIDNRTMLSDITHRLIDKVEEAERKEPRGSTGRGISPAFSDETSQFVVHYSDLLGSKDSFAEKLDARIARTERHVSGCRKVTPDMWRQFFQELSDAERRANQGAIQDGIFSESDFDLTRFCGENNFTFNREVVIDTYWDAGQQLIDRIGDLSQTILECRDKGLFVLGEFGQAYGLDKRHGFPPNVTASHTGPAEFYQSAHIPTEPLHVLGVCKAYDTKVGTHLFLTQITEGHPLGTWLKTLEFGVTTGRQRMVGWFDAVEKGAALLHSGFNDMVINKIDVLAHTPKLKDAGWDGTLKICCGYQLSDGSVTRRMPVLDDVRGTAKPLYIECPTWHEDISELRDFWELPTTAQRYVATMYAATVVAAYGTEGWASKDLPRVPLIGVGPDSSQVILNAPDGSKLMQMADRDVFDPLLGS